MNTKQIVQVIKALMKGPASRMDLAQRLKVNPKSIGRVLTELKAQKLIYVIDYSNTLDGRNRVKIYTFGEGEDAQPKNTQSQEDRSRKSYLRKVATNSVFAPLTTFVGGKSPWQTLN